MLKNRFFRLQIKIQLHKHVLMKTEFSYIFEVHLECNV